jgi:hypothetical protein
LRKEVLNSKKAAREYTKITLTTDPIEEIGSLELFLEEKEPILMIR